MILRAIIIIRHFLTCISSSLEDLAVGVGVLLAVNSDGTVPLPLGLDVLAVLSLLRVELGEGVALVVGSDIEHGEVLLATDDESTLDDRVPVLAVHGGRAEDVLAGSLKTGIEAADQVVGHEDEGQLVVVLVVHAPDGVVLLQGNVLPEPLQGLSLVVVGEVALPVIQVEAGGRQQLAGVLSLGGRSGSGVGGGSGGSGLGLLSLLGLLGGHVGQGRLVEELLLLGNGRVDGLVNDGLVPTSDVGVLLAPLLVKEVLEAAGSNASSKQVGQSDAVANKVGVAEEVVLDDLEGLEAALGRLLDGLLVVRVLSEEWTEPATQRGEDLGVEEGEPLQDGGIAAKGLVLRNKQKFRLFPDLLLLSLAQ